MSYTAFKDGYAKETDFGTSVITAAGATTYLWGAVSQESIHPSPRTTVSYRATGYNAKEVPVGNLWKNRFDLEGMTGLRMQNGILCWAAMGLSSTAGADPYTHTITPTTDGSQLPSFTVQHERSGTATDWAVQFEGVKVTSLTLVHDMKNANFLMARVNWLARKAKDPGFVLTTDPALPATANAAPYVNLERKWDSAGTPVSIDGLQQIEISILNNLVPEFAHTWDTGTYTGRWAQSFIEATRKEYLIRMRYHPSTIEDDLWDELIATGNLKHATFKWIRGTNDYILVTAEDCQVIEHEIKTPPAPEGLLEEVVLEPRKLVITVEDSINGSPYYGE
jgi:hypothetical protein